MNFPPKAGRSDAMGPGLPHERSALPSLHRPGGALHASGDGPFDIDPADTPAGTSAASDLQLDQPTPRPG